MARVCHWVAEGLAWHFLDPPHQLGHSPGLLPFGPHLRSVLMVIINTTRAGPTAQKALGRWPHFLLVL